MNVLIYDHSLVPDSDYQQRVRQLFSTLADVTIRFVNGVLDAAWHIRHFRPDVIVFDWLGDCTPISKLSRSSIESRRTRRCSIWTATV